MHTKQSDEAPMEHVLTQPNNFSTYFNAKPNNFANICICIGFRDSTYISHTYSREIHHIILRYFFLRIIILYIYSRTLTKFMLANVKYSFTQKMQVLKLICSFSWILFLLQVKSYAFNYRNYSNIQQNVTNSRDIIQKMQNIFREKIVFHLCCRQL